MKTLRRVAVLGAGTMGSRIAAHFANAGYPALLLDIVLPDQTDRSAAAKRGLESAQKQKPGGFYTDGAASLVTPGNFEDHLERLRECEWIIEAVTENLEVKRALWRKVEGVRRPDAVVSTNTSGIPLAAISQGFSPEFRRRFLGTHFFNPPRYLHLCEVIPGAETDPEVVAAIGEFIDLRLGKGVVHCKDTPNFIANRIGSFWGATVYKLMVEGDFTIEEVDAITGPLIGLPNSASFRLLDIVGLDIWMHVAKNLYEAVPHDPWRERLLPLPFMQEMMNRRWLGDKTGQGFFQRVGKERAIHAIDWKTLEYHPARKVEFASVEAVRKIEDLPQRLRALVAGDDSVGRFLWSLFSDLFLYSAERIPEIADGVVEIDRAMRWGYANKLGPFELWDALGFEETCARLEKEGRALPDSITAMRRAGVKSFYRAADGGGVPGTEYFDLCTGSCRKLEPRPGILILGETKRARGVVKRNASASLVDVGDGVLCLEFHSKMNSLGAETVEMIYAGLAERERNFEAMIVANEGENFCVGANLALMLSGAQAADWNAVERGVREFQGALMAMKHAAKPVVAAPFQRVLGGGCEVVLHAAKAQASAELYMGLVEVGVGLIPAGGGCKELTARLKDPRRVFELIGMAKVSSSAEDARNMGLLHRQDGITMNRERLIADAKTASLALARDYRPLQPRTDIKVTGENGYAAMRLGAWMMRQAGYISDYDMVIAGKLAHVLSGGRVSGEPLVSEQYLLDLEREAFLSLLGDERTQARMQHMLKTGKPLRN
ncbi:MAG: 3-hydroxyacyl-CoA dehydrogenase/enoyl-CoA hydratase family protein [Bryobacteraceae bacterium]|nr:3-hydroxyacyl-CoA dehydrogenase/enoyl-CoA hydratase family protein [Bryobacteraceae bacterium]